jgi:hypothetical protein
LETGSWIMIGKRCIQVRVSQFSSWAKVHAPTSEDALDRCAIRACYWSSPLLLSRLDDGIGDLERQVAGRKGTVDTEHWTLGLAGCSSLCWPRYDPSRTRWNKRPSPICKKERKMQRSESDTAPRHTAENRALKRIPQKLHLGTKPLRYFFYRHFSLVIIILCKKTNLGFSCKLDSPLSKKTEWAEIVFDLITKGTINEG